DHREVGGDRYPVIEEARVLQLTVLAVDVFLVERPADALRGPALKLALDITRMDGFAGILGDQVAQHRGTPGLAVDLDIANMVGKTRPRVLRTEFAVARDRSAGLGRKLRNLLEGERGKIAGVGTGRTGLPRLPNDRIFGNAPHQGRPRAQPFRRLTRGL